MKKETLERMKSEARRAADRAYAPYSGFKVGAAVLDDRGRVYAGCNVENASYGLTVCAERNAVARAVCAGAKSLQAVLVFTGTEKLTPPCGACLQVIAELGDNPEVILTNWRKVRRLRLKDCLPLKFSF